MNNSQNRLLELLDKVLEGSSSDEERQEFGVLLEQSPELSSEFLDQMQTHSLLQLQSRRGEKLVQLAEASSVRDAQPNNRDSLIGRYRNLRAFWVTAAALLISATVFFWQWQSSSAESHAIAEVVDHEGLKWSKRSNAQNEHGLISQGLLELEAGKAVLQFRSGVAVDIIGPASMRIESDMLVRLDKGQASAHVPKWATGFTIETPDVEVIDLGTKFGVLARGDNSTDVLVFEGEVDYKPSFDTHAELKRLTQGEGVRVSRLGDVDRVVEVRRELGSNKWSTENAVPSEGIFKSVGDNILPSDSGKFYEIVPQGLNEEARAYVDRPHEWNSITEEGFPDFLKNVDYLRTFNDFKYWSELEIKVELAKPAVVYVFYDNRVPAPEWLTSQFVDTGVDIGLDEGPWEYGDPSIQVAVGGGKSIDQTFSVWRRECFDLETLILGSMGQHPGARAVYGIAASPLE